MNAPTAKTPSKLINNSSPASLNFKKPIALNGSPRNAVNNNQNINNKISGSNEETECLLSLD